MTGEAIELLEGILDLMPEGFGPWEMKRAQMGKIICELKHTRDAEVHVHMEFALSEVVQLAFTGTAKIRLGGAIDPQQAVIAKMTLVQLRDWANRARSVTET